MVWHRLFHHPSSHPLIRDSATVSNVRALWDAGQAGDDRLSRVMSMD
jgi:hypothetical protein